MSTRTLALAVALIAATALPAEGQRKEKEEKERAKEIAKEIKKEERAEKRADRREDRRDDERLVWGPGPSNLPAGSRMALLNGDPRRPGPFTLMLEMPAGYVLPPHRHLSDEHIMVRSGELRYGLGDRIDEASMRSLGAGQDVTLPANTNHFAVARTRTVIAISGMGPYEVRPVRQAASRR